MFFHTMKYTLLNLLRDKGQVFWCVAFPLLLGTMFHFALADWGVAKVFPPPGCSCDGRGILRAALHV